MLRLCLTAGLILMYSSSAPSLFAKAGSCPEHEQLRPLLNSERIESCFGSYGVEVIEQHDNLRVSSLYSQHEDKRITRTLAVTRFYTELPAELEKPLQLILAGGSMGSTLEAAGWRVEKRHRYFGEVAMPDGFRRMARLEDNSPDQQLAVQVYDLWVIRGGHEVRLALLAELHDPRYLTLQDLGRIYEPLAIQLDQVDTESNELLQRAATVQETP